MNAIVRDLQQQDGVRERDWRPHGYTDPLRDSPIGSKLTDPIHPMFSFELDERAPQGRTTARWDTLTIEEYKLLDQPLRLASKCLESTPSCDAICSILEGERYIPQDKPMHLGVAVFEFRDHSLPPSVMQERAKGVLKRLGASICFTALTKDIDYPWLQGDYGKAHPLIHEHPDGIAVTHRPELKGLASLITLRPEYLTTLKVLLQTSEENPVQIEKLYLELAVTICHEVMHAIQNAIAPDLLATFKRLMERYEKTGQGFGKVNFKQPFYEGERIAEQGYFWENKVFGGILKHTVRSTDNPLFFTEWPSWFQRDKKVYPERAPPRKLCYQYLVSTYYIRNIQTQEFWDAVSRSYSDDLLALRIQKRIGIACWYNDDDDWDHTWNFKDHENYSQMPKWSRRAVLDDLSLSPCAELLNETIEERNSRLEDE